MLIYLLACTPPEDSGDTDDTDLPTEADTDTDVDADTDTDADADTDTDPFIPVQVECGPLDPLPETFVLLAQQGPHEDFTFDATGGLVGVNGSGNLVSKTRDGDVTLIGPNIGEAKGTRFLPDGSVVIAQTGLGVIGRVMPDGEYFVHASVAAANGLATDPWGNTWAATGNGQVERITIDGDRTVAASVAGTLDGISFAPDYSRLYFNSEFGAVRVIDIDEGNAIGEPELFVNVPLNFSILDGMTTDSCGNVYVARMDGQVFRYLPDGSPAGQLHVQMHPGLQVTPALNFGSGVGGFDRDKLYVMNFLGGVLEADIGIDGRLEPHYPVP